MVPRPHPLTNENRHHRFAQHRGSPRRGVNRVIEQIEDKFTRCPECRSFSVKQTRELTVKERIRAAFVPVKVQRCKNCSYRFVEYGSFSTSLRHVVHAFISSRPGKFILMAILIAAVVLVTLLLLTGGKEKEPVKSTGKKPIQSIEKKQEPEEPGSKPQEKPLTPVLAGEILLGNSNRFGVNWRPLGEGVLITRLSNGSLKRAGFLVGDILVEVGGKKVVGEGMDLEAARNDVFYGRRAQVLIKVLRGEETLLFKMIKNRHD